MDFWWRALLSMFGIPLLILGILASIYGGIDEGAGLIVMGGYLAALVGFLLCSVAFFYRK